jgi:phage shock protein PspC (stress-responsive transcriptional regulator)
MTKTTKKLYRSRIDHMLAGVCGGVAEYFHWDVSLVRLAMIIGLCLTAFVPLTFGYLVAALAIPLEPVSSGSCES